MKKLMLLTATVLFTASVFAGQGNSVPAKKVAPQETTKATKAPVKKEEAKKETAKPVTDKKVKKSAAKKVNTKEAKAPAKK